MGAVYIPTWSPDGRHIAFVLGESTMKGTVVYSTNNLYITDYYGRDFRLLLANSSAELNSSFTNQKLIWSPDGQYLAFYLETFLTAYLWVMTLDGEQIIQLVGQSPSNSQVGALPGNAYLSWSADSQTLYILAEDDGLFYHTLSAEMGSQLSEAQAVMLPDVLAAIDTIVLSPMTPDILLYDDGSNQVWHLNIVTGAMQRISEMNSANLTALVWSNDGRRFGWVQHAAQETRIFTLVLGEDTASEYFLPARVADDLSFTLWLPENPAQVLVRMQRGSICRNLGTEMICIDPNFFGVTWFGVRP